MVCDEHHDAGPGILTALRFAVDERVSCSQLKLAAALKLWQTSEKGISASALDRLNQVLFTFAPGTLSEFSGPSRYMFNKSIGVSPQRDGDFFYTMAWCPTCSSIYHLKDCLADQCGPFYCTHRPFPDHPHTKLRGTCGAVVGNTVRKPNGRKNEFVFVPTIKFPVGSITDQLAEMYARPHFEKQCEHWRQRRTGLVDPELKQHETKGSNQAASIWRDIYDGNMWASLNQAHAGHDEDGDIEEHMSNFDSFFTKLHHLGFGLSVDWFQVLAV